MNWIAVYYREDNARVELTDEQIACRRRPRSGLCASIPQRVAPVAARRSAGDDRGRPRPPAAFPIGSQA